MADRKEQGTNCEMPYSQEAQEIRQKVLEDYQVLDNVHDEALDRIVKLAALICGCETSFISFLDWHDRLVRMNHRYGLDLEAAPIIPGETFCDHSVMSDGCLHLRDAKEHPVYGKSRFVVGEPFISFYYSVGLVLDCKVGVPVGVLCVIDQHPRELTDKQSEMMNLLAQDIVMHLQYKRTLRKTQEYVQELLAQNQGLERSTSDKSIVANNLAGMQQKMNSQFVATLGHELRTPTNIIQCSVILLESTELQKEQAEYVHMAQEGCRQLQRILDKSVDHLDVKSHLATTHLAPFSVHVIVRELIKEHNNSAQLGQRELKSTIAEDVPETLIGDSAKIFQILRYFLENAIKFTENDIGTIGIHVSRSKHQELSFDSPTSTHTDSSTNSSNGKCNNSQCSCYCTFCHGSSNSDTSSDSSKYTSYTFNNGCDSCDCTSSTNETSDVSTNYSNNDSPKPKPMMNIDFSVCDNGIGVNAETYALLFNFLMQGDRSTTRKHGGMGLGLAISYDLATMMGGHVRVTTKNDGSDMLCSPGNEADLPHAHGSCFTLTVPLEVTSLPPGRSELSSPAIPHSSPLLLSSSAELAAMLPEFSSLCSLDPSSTTKKPLMSCAPSASIPSADFPAKVVGSKLKILVVEDNLLNQKVINHMLLKLGYKADYVHDGAKAVTKYSLAPIYNLILMDLHMPVMDGLTAARIILDYARGLDKPTRIVAVTSSVSQEDRDNCKAIGMSGYLEKPISLKALLSVLQSAEESIS